MPTYEYECKNCGHTFEAFQSMKDESLKSCPRCGMEVRRLIHGGAGVIFKGSGFYVTGKAKAEKTAAKTPGPEKPAAQPGAAASGAEGKNTPAGGSAPPAASTEKKAAGQ